MRRVRIIPVLLLQNEALVKSIRFQKHKYVGDPINAVRIFNEKEVDEIVILDINASKTKSEPNITQLSEIAGEAFMPLAYGGGVSTLEQVKSILYQGAEKVIINTSAFDRPSLIEEIAQQFGSQSVVVSIDIKKDWLGRYRVYRDNGRRNTGKSPLEWAKEVEALGAGEILLTSIDKDGTFTGYDVQLLKEVSSAIQIPLVACGGAASMMHFREAITEGEASAVAAGSFFVYRQPHRAVLISYPTQSELTEQLFQYL